MSDDGQTEFLAKINHAGEVIGEELFHAGFDRAQEYSARFGLTESETVLAMSNAYFRVCVSANAAAFGLDEGDLARRMQQCIKDAAREQPQDD